MSVEMPSSRPTYTSLGSISNSGIQPSRSFLTPSTPTPRHSTTADVQRNYNKPIPESTGKKILKGLFSAGKFLARSVVAAAIVVGCTIAGAAADAAISGVAGPLCTGLGLGIGLGLASAFWRMTSSNPKDSSSNRFGDVLLFFDAF